MTASETNRSYSPTQVAELLEELAEEFEEPVESAANLCRERAKEVRDD